MTCSCKIKIKGPSTGSVIEYCALHATAPEMLEVLKKCQWWLVDVDDDKEPETVNLIADIKAIVAKVEAK